MITELQEQIVAMHHKGFNVKTTAKRLGCGLNRVYDTLRELVPEWKRYKTTDTDAALEASLCTNGIDITEWKKKRAQGLLRCSNCHAWKIKTDFHLSKNRKTGYYPYCKFCESARRKAAIFKKKEEQSV